MQQRHNAKQVNCKLHFTLSRFYQAVLNGLKNLTSTFLQTIRYFSDEFMFVGHMRKCV